jgi:PAS domain S-box-containing protein
MAQPEVSRHSGGGDLEQVLHRLGERVKELTALHAAAGIFQQQRTIPELLQEIVAILPPAWQYPDVTCARIVYDGREYVSAGFRESPWKQAATFSTGGGRGGTVEVYYGEERPSEAEGPFLAEERSLIDSMAELLRIYLGHKLAEDSLHESEERFRITFEQAAVGIVHVGLDGRFLRANGKFCEITGFSSEEIVERSFQEITCEHDVPPGLECRDKLMAGRVHSCALEKRYIRKGGTPVWVTETVSLVRGRSGAPKYFIYVLEDITGRKQSEGERKRLVHDLQERIKELTAMYRTMEIVQRPGPVPELLREVAAMLPEAWQYPEVTEARIVFDGREYATPGFRPAEWSQVARFTTYDAYDGFIEVVYLEERPPEHEGPFLAEERNLIDSLASMLREFLNRRKAEKAFAESESLYRNLAEAAHDLVYIIGADGRFQYFNRYAEDITGEDPDAFVGKASGDVYPPEAAHRHLSFEAEVRESGRPVYFEELTRFPRRSLWTANWLVPVRDEESQSTSILGVVRDIDERKRAEDALLASEKAIGRMASCLDAMDDEVRESVRLLERALEEGIVIDRSLIADALGRLKSCAGQVKGGRSGRS